MNPRNPRSFFQLLHRYRKLRRRLARLDAFAAPGLRLRRLRSALRRRLAGLALRLNPLGTRRLTVALVVCAAIAHSSPAALAQAPKITTLTPGTNASEVALDSDVKITFSTTMNTSTLTAANIRIFGSQSGFLSTSGSFSGDLSRVFNPTSDFGQGELISVTVTGASATSGTAIAKPIVYSFRTDVDGGTAIFASKGFGGAGDTRSVALGDLDGDGDLDAIVTSYNNAHAIRLNNGDASFASSTFGAASAAREIKLADLDGDGDLDALIVNYNQTDHIWLNNGDGTFTSDTFGATAGNRRSNAVDIGDLDGDGDLDAIVVKSNAQDEIWLNDGGADFSLGQSFGAGTTSPGFVTLFSNDVALGDLDNDGDLDAIVLRTINFGNNVSQEIWLNNGDATLASTGFLPSTSYARVEVGDLDGDGNLDALISDGSSGLLWLGNGDGSFSTSSAGLTAALRSSAFALGDLDGDGDLDIMAGRNSLYGNAAWLNNGTASFTERSLFDSPSSNNALGTALGDLDGDGDLDAVIVNSNSSNEIWINDPLPFIIGLSPDKNTSSAAVDGDIQIDFLHTMATGTLTTATIPTHANLIVYGSQTGHLGTSAAVSFIDDDETVLINPAADFKAGEQIMVTVTGANKWPSGQITQATVYSFLAAAGGGSTVFASSGFGTGESVDLAFGDLDGDGDLDAIVATYYKPQEIWLNNGDGSFSSSTFGDVFKSDVALGDLDGDGDLDAILSGYFGYAQEIWLGNGDGSFSSSTFGGGGSQAVALGDLDGDGDLDAVIANYSGEAQELWLNRGDGSFVSSSFGGGDSRGLAIGDIDGDCDLDLVIANYGGADHIWLNDGHASFTSSSFGDGDGRDVALSDLDGDGDLDAIIARSNTADDIWKNNGTGGFAQASLGGASSIGVALGDLDGDGDIDAIIGKDGGAQEIWRNNGDATFNSKTFGGGDTRGLNIGDLDGDGDLDAVIANYVTSVREIWLNDGDPKIVLVSPATNANAVAQDSDIEICFNTGMDVATLTTNVVPNNANLIVYGMQRGHTSTNAALSYTNGNAKVVIDPAEDFRAGEEIMVTVTGAAIASGVALDKPTVFSFRAAVTTGSASFSSSGFGGVVNSREIALGDLDGDGDLDAVIALFGSTQVILINNGGSFASSTFGGSNARDVDLGDFDGDGDLDAILGRDGSDEIWLNNGDGTFTSSALGGAGNTHASALGDLDGDGDLDIIVLNYNSSSDVVWFNNGDGSFASASPGGFFGSRYGLDAVIGDIDNDGDLDMLVPTQFTYGLVIWRNNGDGTFNSGSFNSGKQTGVALGDLDGDGDVDAILTKNNGQTDLVLHNNGSGGFNEFDLGSGANSSGVDIGDLDGDGDLDAVVSDEDGTNTIWLNNGDGFFASQTFSGNAAEGVVLGDIDDDGDLDAIVNSIFFGDERWLNQPPPPPPVFPEITALAPATNAIAAAVDTDIDISFSTTMSTSSLTASNIRIFGNLSGFLSTKGSFSGDLQRSFDPTNDFKAGEMISVSVTGAQSQAGVTASQATVYSFQVAVTQGNAAFETTSIEFGPYRGLDVGDLDGDGDLDAMIAHAQFGGQRLWLNNGDASFATSSLGGGRGAGVSFGDLDADCDLDVIVARAGYAQEVWLNNGDASFSLTTFGEAFGNSRAIAIGDLDGDGDLDAVIAGFGAEEIWLNNGDGSFSSSTFGGGGSEALALGDLDGDGDLDVLIANSGSANDLWLNNGDASFSSSSFGAVNGSSTGVAIGDLDGDGDLDAILSHYNQGQSILLNNGDASFSSSSMSVQKAKDVRLGDLDGDGDLDAFFAVGTSFAGPLAQAIWLNDGSAGFTQITAGSLQGFAAALGDLDGDGDLDAIITDEYYPGESQVWLNGAPLFISNLNPAANNKSAADDSDISISFSQVMDTGSLTSATLPNNANLIAYGMQTGHITTSAAISYTNGNSTVVIDPAADFRPGERVMLTVTGATSVGGETLTRATVYEFLAQVTSGSGVLVSSSFGGAADAHRDVAIGDLDGDGDLDAILSSADNAREVWLNNGDLSFSSRSEVSGDLRGLALGDLDGDGDLDAFFGGADYGAHQVWLNNGNATFQSADFGAGTSMDVVLGDLDGDGDLDAIVASDDASANQILLNNGDGSFSVQLFGTGDSRAAALGDLDGDGDLDAILANDNNEAQAIWLNNGDASFSSSSFGNGNSRDVEFGDLDCDGDLDALIINYGGAHDLWLGNGDGTFTTSLVCVSSGSGTGVALGDLDGDGDLDAFISSYSDPATILLNDGAAGFSSSTSAVPSGGESVALGDLDGDGDLDAIQTNYDSGPNRIWQNVPTPKIASLSTSCTVATSASLALTVQGSNFGNTTAQLSVLNSSGATIGTLALVIGSSSATTIQTTIPAGFVSTAGTLTLTVGALFGSAATTITVHSPVSIDGASCAFNDAIQPYTALPVDPAADHNWVATGGVIVSGREDPEVFVDWDDGLPGTLRLTRTFASGCTSSSVVAVSPASLPTVTDFAVTSTESTVTIAVLSNDAQGLTLIAVDDPANGSASVTNSQVVYTPDAGFSGRETFEYTIENNLGCQVTGNVVVVVGLADNADPNLVFVEQEKRGVGGVGGVVGLKRVEKVAVSPDGRHVYAAGRSDHSLVVFERNSSSGTLSYVERHRQGRSGVQGINLISDVEVSPDGQQVYAVGYRSNAIAVFNRTASTGTLSFAEWKRQGQLDGGTTIDGMKRPQNLAVSPDGKNVYVAGRSSNAVAVFSRSSTNGTLTYLERVKDGSGGVDGLAQAFDIAVSPNGANLYAAGFKDNAVAVFSRSSTNGSLSFLERIKDGNGGVDGLRGAIAVTVSSDNDNVIVAGLGDNAIAVFNRSATNGSLSFAERHRDGSGGVDGLLGVRDVKIAPGGKQVYAAGESDRAIAVFLRKTNSGSLRYAGLVKDGVDGVDGINRPRGLAVSPDDAHIYAAGTYDNAVAVFRSNLQPVAVNDAGFGVPANNSIVISALINDFDPDGDAVTITSKTDGALGTVSITDAGTTLTYDAAAAGGSDSFTYTISDGNGGSSTATVSLSVSSGGRKAGWDAVPGEAQQPAVLSDLQIRPNPTAGRTAIVFRLESKQNLRMRIVAMTGQQLFSRSLGSLAAGEHELAWNGNDNAGRPIADGVYYVELIARDDSGTTQRIARELVLLR